MDMQDFNKSIIDEFCANNGVVGGQFAGASLLLLNTTGAKTGLSRVNPLAFLADKNRHVIIASYAGGPTNPPWYHNLIANPEVYVEVDSDSFRAKAELASEPERSELYKKIADAMPAFAEYQTKTTRVIPVIALIRTD